jgi:hypothetical protein
MSRGLWFVAGAGAGIYAVVRGRRAAEAFTADGMSDRLGAAALGLRLFRDEVAQGKAEAEADLRERLGLVPHGVPELAASSATVEQASDTRTDTDTSTDADPDTEENS